MLKPIFIFLIYIALHPPMPQKFRPPASVPRKNVLPIFTTIYLSAKLFFVQYNWHALIHSILDIWVPIWLGNMQLGGNYAKNQKLLLFGMGHFFGMVKTIIMCRGSMQQIKQGLWKV
jgi:hypothetical protein